MSKIPEGTQYIESGCGEKGFRKFEKGCWWFFEGHWRHVDWKMGNLIPVTAHPLYVTQPDPWNGEGLPPVGAVCEFQGDISACPSDPWKKGLHDGVECRVIAHFKSRSLDLVAFTFTHPNGDTEVEQALPGALRPVRTAEQIAAERYQTDLRELAEHIAGYLGHDDPRPSDVGIAEYLLDHDYRKQVQP